MSDADVDDERTRALKELLDAVRTVIDGAPMSDRSGRTDRDRIDRMEFYLKEYETADRALRLDAAGDAEEATVP